MVWPKRALEYIREGSDSDMDMMIQFQCMCADCLFSDYFHMPFSLRRMKYAFGSWQKKLFGKAWNMLYLENHDHPRIVSRYGSEKYREASAKTLAVSYLFLQGTPFVYQGQEIGMTSWYPERSDMYEDVQTRNQYPKLPEEKRLPRLWKASRDSARTPMQWTAGENAGFTTGTPWFYVNQNYTEINVAQQESDPDSVLNFYRKAIALRKRLPVVRDGSYRDHNPLSGKLYVYTRETEKQTLLVVCSFTEKPARFRMPRGFTPDELLLCNYPVSEERTLRPYECRVYLQNRS